MTRSVPHLWSLPGFRIGCSFSSPVEIGGTSPVTLECGLMFKVASWNLNSVRSRLTHVTMWLKAREPDVLLLQELKGTEFPSEVFKPLGYESVAVRRKPITGLPFCRDIRWRRLPRFSSGTLPTAMRGSWR